MKDPKLVGHLLLIPLTPLQSKNDSGRMCLRQESSGVAPLKGSDGQLVCDSKGKAQVLNNQFQSVFTDEPPDSLPPLSPSAHNSMPDIHISPTGVLKLLKGLNPHKAMGPDNLHPRVLKELANEISPILSIIFQRSFDSSVIPTDWKAANVTPLFKKDKSTRQVTIDQCL